MTTTRTGLSTLTDARKNTSDDEHAQNGFLVYRSQCHHSPEMLLFALLALASAENLRGRMLNQTDLTGTCSVFVRMYSENRTIFKVFQAHRNQITPLDPPFFYEVMGSAVNPIGVCPTLKCSEIPSCNARQTQEVALGFGVAGGTVLLFASIITFCCIKAEACGTPPKWLT